jgi:hypothetical protein
MAGERDPSDPLTRGDLHDALRFLHAMALQGQIELDRIDAVLAALIQTLLETRRLDPVRVEALLPAANARLEARAGVQASVEVGPALDKYEVSSPTDLDCAALIPLCQGRCCRLMFSLSFQDLDEGQVRWDYRRPYRIRQREDGVCVHADPATHACGVYEVRPATCRRYDCRKDPRIWEDFERRIPAPMERVMRAPGPPRKRLPLVPADRSPPAEAADDALRMDPEGSDDGADAPGSSLPPRR